MPIKKVYLEITNRCNLNCAMCYRHGWHVETKDMNRELLEKVIKNIMISDTISEVVLGGIGEPSYAGDICMVIRALKGKNVVLTTNGTLMNEEMQSVLVAGVNRLIVSIDGMADTFYAMRQFPIESVIQNIKALNNHKLLNKAITPLISLQMVLSKQNVGEMREIIDLAHELKIPQVIFSNLLPVTIEDQGDILYKLGENNDLKHTFQSVRNYAFRNGIEVLLPEVQLKTERRCRFIEEDTLMITSTGQVTPCYRLSHDGSEVVFGRSKTIEAFSFGNVAQHSLQEIWNGSAYSTFRDVVYNNHYPSCIDCDLVEGCDMVRSTTADCYGVAPSCGDCLWSRKIVYCV